jgi:hypothetical protein
MDGEKTSSTMGSVSPKTTLSKDSSKPEKESSGTPKNPINVKTLNSNVEITSPPNISPNENLAQKNVDVSPKENLAVKVTSPPNISPNENLAQKNVDVSPKENLAVKVTSPPNISPKENLAAKTGSPSNLSLQENLDDEPNFNTRETHYWDSDFEVMENSGSELLPLVVYDKAVQPKKAPSQKPVPKGKFVTPEPAPRSPIKAPKPAPKSSTRKRQRSKSPRRKNRHGKAPKKKQKTNPVCDDMNEFAGHKLDESSLLSFSRSADAPSMEETARIIKEHMAAAVSAMPLRQSFPPLVLETPAVKVVGPGKTFPPVKRSKPKQIDPDALKVDQALLAEVQKAGRSIPVDLQNKIAACLLADQYSVKMRVGDFVSTKSFAGKKLVPKLVRAMNLKKAADRVAIKRASVGAAALKEKQSPTEMKPAVFEVTPWDATVAAKLLSLNDEIILKGIQDCVDMSVVADVSVDACLKNLSIACEQRSLDALGKAVVRMRNATTIGQQQENVKLYVAVAVALYDLWRNPDKSSVVLRSMMETKRTCDLSLLEQNLNALVLRFSPRIVLCLPFISGFELENLGRHDTESLNNLINSDRFNNVKASLTRAFVDVGPLIDQLLTAKTGASAKLLDNKSTSHDEDADSEGSEKDD